MKYYYFYSIGVWSVNYQWYYTVQSFCQFQVVKMFIFLDNVPEMFMKGFYCQVLLFSFLFHILINSMSEIVFTETILNNLSALLNNCWFLNNLLNITVSISVHLNLYIDDPQQSFKFLNSYLVFFYIIFSIYSSLILPVCILFLYIEP